MHLSQIDKWKWNNFFWSIYAWINLRRSQKFMTWLSLNMNRETFLYPKSPQIASAPSIRNASEATNWTLQVTVPETWWPQAIATRTGKQPKTALIKFGNSLYMSLHGFVSRSQCSLQHWQNAKLRLQMLLDYIVKTKSRSKKLLEPTELKQPVLLFSFAWWQIWKHRQ